MHMGKLMIYLGEQTRSELKAIGADTINSIRLRCSINRIDFADVLNLALSVVDAMPAEAEPPIDNARDAANDINDVRRLANKWGISFDEILNVSAATYRRFETSQLIQ